MNLPPCDFKPLGHSTPPTPLILSSALFATEFGLHNDGLLRGLSLLHAFVGAGLHYINDGDNSSLVFWQFLPMSAHWPMSTVYQGWQLEKTLVAL
jgi:hypothetical protein